MIRITSLNKVYKSKKRKTCHAVKNVNLTLPDAGLVFVLGKSGSGKSTLLNLIGGLDSISSGTIEVDGNDLSAFKEKDFCNYRNTHIGFIFQDYHLIDELTVYENIVLSLNLRRIEDKELVKAALEKVDLAGYEDRYPTELSGGEQQRVAIARAIVKNPRIILADEPTGNLDTHTSKAIVELLKALSKDCLILIVSHNVNDANAYADRIIELAKGKIISDKSRNPDFADHITLDGDKLVYPKDTYLSDEDIEIINDNSNKKLIKRTDKFIATAENTEKSKNVKIENKNLTLGKELNLSGKFIKNKTLAISLSAFMVSVIMIIMALAQTIVNFDGGMILHNEMTKNGQQSLLLSKTVDDITAAHLDGNYQIEIGENDMQKFYDAGYEGNIYPIVNANVPISTISNLLGNKGAYFTKNFLLKETFGTMIVDENFLEKKFGEVKYLASLDEHLNHGLIITDYVADSILATNPNYLGKTYEDILGKYSPAGFRVDVIYINAIIYTGYAERHRELIDELTDPESSIDLESVYSDKRFISFSNDIYDSLGYSYSLNPNFYEDSALSRTFYSIHNLVINDTINCTEKSHLPIFSILSKEDYNKLDGGLSMSRELYNTLFNTNYDDTNIDSFSPHTIKITMYRLYDIDKESPIFTTEITIDTLLTHGDAFILSADTNPLLEDIIRNADTYYTGLYFDSVDGIGTVLDLADELNYEPQSVSVEGIHSMTRAVDVFVPIFELISIFLYIGVIFILMNFASKMINDKMHEIGILKALGTKNGSIGVVFGLQVGLIALLTCGLSTLGYYLFIDVANDILIESIHRIAPSWTLPDLQFLTFKPEIALMNCILIFALAFVSLIFPMIKIKAIKPVKIIKAKE